MVEKGNPQLSEAVETLAQRPFIVEFRTFSSKENGKLVHLFEPLTITEQEVESSRYWNLLNSYREEVNKIRPEIKMNKPTAYYCKVPVGHTNVHLEWNFKTRPPRLGVELHLEGETHSENSGLLAKLEADRVEIENTIGEPLVFQSLWGRNWSRAYIIREAKDTSDFTQWAVATMIKFYDAFKPVLDRVDTRFGRQRRKA